MPLRRTAIDPQEHSWTHPYYWTHPRRLASVASDETCRSGSRVSRVRLSLRGALHAAQPTVIGHRSVTLGLAPQAVQDSVPTQLHAPPAPRALGQQSSAAHDATEAALEVLHSRSTAQVCSTGVFHSRTGVFHRRSAAHTSPSPLPHSVRCGPVYHQCFLRPSQCSALTRYVVADPS
eukprot:3785080-Pyramimonas_sp.AAC.2